MTEPTNAELSARLYKWVNFVGDACAQDLALAAQRLSEPVEVRVGDQEWGTNLRGTFRVFNLAKNAAISDALEAGRPVLLIPGDA